MQFCFSHSTFTSPTRCSPTRCSPPSGWILTGSRVLHPLPSHAMIQPFIRGPCASERQHVVLSVAAFGDSQSLFYSHLVSSSSSSSGGRGSVQSLTSVQLLYSASLQAWTSTSSAGIGDLGCLLSKCCLKVLGSGICVWTQNRNNIKHFLPLFHTEMIFFVEINLKMMPNLQMHLSMSLTKGLRHN